MDNKDLTVEHAYKIGRFWGGYYSKGNKAKFDIGKDTRRSSYMFIVIKILIKEELYS